MTSEAHSDAELERLMREYWPAAQARWSRFLLLGVPVACSASPGIAQIDLGTRRVSLNIGQIRERGLAWTVEALLAHEVGHHVRYPGSLAVAARMRLLEKSLLPLDDYSLVNLFTDLMINERLGHDLEDQLAAIYKAFIDEVRWQEDPAFLFYLMIYEELWQRTPGDLLCRWHGEFESEYPQARAEAQLLADRLFRIGPNVYTQFIYFVSVVSRYVQPRFGDKPVGADPYECGHGMPSAEDWASALEPDGREREAIRRAEREGWIDRNQVERLTDSRARDRRIASIPGSGTADASLVPEVMAAYYRQQAERYLVRPPAQRRVGEGVVPTTLDPWEPGEPLRDIDWLATLVERGPVLAAAEPLKRTRVAELEGYDVPLWQPRMEIYLDVSGSMPDPRMTRNALTLAAQVLVAGTLRASGWARALLYSHETVTYWNWCRSEAELSRFLMHYVGGGTRFPFEVLARSVAECAADQPIRVVISDSDFHHNYASNPENAGVFAEAATRSARLILLLHQPNPDAAKVYTSAGATVITIAEMEDFPRMAADLAGALFDRERTHVAH